MADPGSIDDLLSSEIDESAVSALVGSLESQLASSTNRDLSKTPSDSSVNNNHISSITSNATTTNSLFSTNASQVNVSQKGLSSHTNSTINFTLGQGNKSVPENQILGITSIINSTGAPSSGVNALVNSQNSDHHVSLPSNTSSVRNLVHPHQNNVTDSSVHISSPSPGLNASTVINSSAPQIHVTTNNFPSTQTVSGASTRGTNSAANAIYNLANIASEQKPMTIAQNGNHAQIQKGRSVIASPKQFVVKQESSNIQVKQEVGSPFRKTDIVNVKDGANIQTIIGQTTQSGVLPSGTPVIGGRPMVNTLKAAPVGSNVITVRAPTNQQVTVVRPPLSSTTSGSVQFNPVRHVTSKTGQVRVSTPIRMTNHPHQISIAPRQSGAGNTITLSPGLQLPPNTILMKNEHGQLMLVSTAHSGSATQGQGPVLATKVQNVRPSTSIAMGRPATSPAVVIQPQTGVGRGQPQVLPNTVTTSSQVLPGTPSVGQPQAAVTQPGAAAGQQGMLQNVEKCKNFLSTLIKLAQSQPQETVRNVRELIQGLIDGKVEPQTFTEKLQVELKSSPQPYLVPFLKKSLPLLRHYLIMDKMTIDGVKAPPPEIAGMHPMPAMSSVQQRPVAPFGVQQMVMRQGVPGQMYVRPGNKVLVQGAPTSSANLVRIKTPIPIQGNLASGVNSFQTRVVKASGSPAPKEKQKFEALKDGDDDINDVATMGGVNLSEESKNILATNADFIGTQIRSCKDEAFLFHGPLMARIHEIAKKHGLDEVSLDVANMISHATQERLRDMVEKLSTIAEHRIEIYKMDSRYEVTNDVRTQLKFLEEIDKLEKKRHEEQEREILLRAIKSRSKNEDPEQLKLKQKAKELQAAEMEEVRQREANLTALAAIGPRKKRKIETTDSGQTAGTSSSTGANGSGVSSNISVMNRPRTKRVNLRDMLFLLEQERSVSKSNLLYKTFLK
ncbi:hypothetical protein SNE40_007760 [Patella caerulea]|uniref:TAFH domain-containing protein n=1 Tax=Patella caerulea TaxID=87958 RepID=A0AAN8K486_PATCE